MSESSETESKSSISDLTVRHAGNVYTALVKKLYPGEEYTVTKFNLTNNPLPNFNRPMCFEVTGGYLLNRAHVEVGDLHPETGKWWFPIVWTVRASREKPEVNAIYETPVFHRYTYDQEDHYRHNARVSITSDIPGFHQHVHLKSNPADRFLHCLWYSAGDAATALLRFKGAKFNNRMSRMGTPEVRKESGELAVHAAEGNNTRGYHWRCNACSKYFIEIENCRKHVGECVWWDAWDAKASTLLFGDLSQLSIALDTLMSNGDL